MVTKLYKKGRRIICYIKQSGGEFIVCTGKPSDACCISWHYDNIESAEFTAKEYFDNRTNFLK